MSTVTIVATVEADNVPPRVRLDVTDVGTPNLFAVTVTRLNPDGSVVPVRTTDGNPLTLTTSGVTRVGLVYDYEMPFGSIVSYSTAEDPATISAEVSVDETRAWLIHPGVPALSLPITIASIGARSRNVQRSVMYPMGRKSPVVVTSGVRQSAEYVLSLFTRTEDEAADVEALTSDAGTLLLNVDPAKGWGFSSEYVSVGDMVEGRLTRYIGEPLRTHEMSITVVDRPAGGTQAERTYIDLLVYPTYAALQAAYPTYLDLLAGP